ncbi:MAG: hypothetical protein ACKOB8_02425 [Mycobacterium sp.]
MSEPPYYPVPVAKPSAARWIAPLALVIALLAAGAAGWALVKPEPKTATPGAVADPKVEVCGAFKTVSEAVSLRTNITPPADLGPVTAFATEAIAANARLAMAGGAAYLLDKLPPNTPEELAGDVRSLADDLNTIAMNALAGVSNDTPDQSTRLRSAEATSKKIAALCKQ